LAWLGLLFKKYKFYRAKVSQAKPSKAKPKLSQTEPNKKATKTEIIMVKIFF